MNIYENVATQVIVSFFYKEPFWKKEILFNFLLKPFGTKLENIKDVISQNVLPGTIPDFTIITNENKRYNFEVKINDADLTESEFERKKRDAFLIRKGYKHINNIPSETPKLFWEDLFGKIDKIGAAKEFSRLGLVREYMKDPIHTIRLNEYEVAMFCLPDEIIAVYSLSEKLKTMCEKFLKSKGLKKKDINSTNNGAGIGCFWSGHNYFIGLSLLINNKNYSFSIAFYLPQGTQQLTYNGKTINDNEVHREFGDSQEWAYIPMYKDILIQTKEQINGDDEQQNIFNDEANRVWQMAKDIIKQNNIKTTPIIPE